MLLGISSAAFYGVHETEEAAHVVSLLPLDCCEVFLQTDSEYTLDFARICKRNLRGVPCTSIHPLGASFENSMMGSSQRQRNDARSLFCRILDAGAELGATRYVYHGRNTPQQRILPWNMEWNAEAYAYMSEEAAKRGMRICWENVCWCQLTGAERVLAARQVLPDVRFTLDIKQAMRAGENPLDVARAMGGALDNVHIVDWTADGKLCMPGEGEFDFDAFFVVLREIGYDGPVIIEPYSYLVRSEEALAESIAYLRRWIWAR